MASPPPSGPRRRWAWTLASVLVSLVQGGLLLDVARQKSDTVDEDIYLPAAALLWARGDDAPNNDSPILPKWAFAAAMRAVNPALEHTPAGLEAAAEHVLWYGGRDRTERLLIAARATTVAVTVGAGWLLRAFALRFGSGAALIAHMLWAFSPTVLASGSLATLDAWVAAAVAALVWATGRFVDRPSTMRGMLVGFLGGLGLACKVTAGGALLIAAIAVAARTALTTPAGPPPWRRVTLVVVLVTASTAAALWAVYRFTVGPVPIAILGEGAPVVTLPFPAWWRGLLEQIAHGTRGHRSYLFGRTGTEGWWWFYLAGLAIKTTVGAQLLALAALVGFARRRKDWADLALLAYPVLLLVVMSAGRAQLGMRYLLPAFPPAIAWIAREVARLAASRPAARVAVGVLAAAFVAESAAVHPDYLMFANRWVGGPAHGARYIIVGDDIGQEQRALADWQARNGLPWIYYTWYSGNPRHWGVEYAEPPCRPQRGVYALQAVEVFRPRRIERGCLDWLTVDPPDERLGHSVYIYRVDRSRVLRLRATPPGGPVFWRSGP